MPLPPEMVTLYLPACAPAGSTSLIKSCADLTTSSSSATPASLISASSGFSQTSGDSSCLSIAISAAGFLPSLRLRRDFNPSYASFTASPAASLSAVEAPAASAATISETGSIRTRPPPGDDSATSTRLPTARQALRPPCRDSDDCRARRFRCALVPDRDEQGDEVAEALEQERPAVRDQGAQRRRPDSSKRRGRDRFERWQVDVRRPAGVARVTFPKGGRERLAQCPHRRCRSENRRERQELAGVGLEACARERERTFERLVEERVPLLRFEQRGETDRCFLRSPALVVD